MIPGTEGAAREFTFTVPDLIRDEDSKIFRYFLWEKMSDPESQETETYSTCTSLHQVSYEHDSLYSSMLLFFQQGLILPRLAGRSASDAISPRAK